MGVFSLLFLGSLTLETRVMYVDVYLCAHSCDDRHASAADHGTRRGHLRGFLTLQLVFRQSLLFTTYWATWPVYSRVFSSSHLPSCYRNTGIAGTLRSGFYMGSGASKEAPAPPPRVCPVSAFPTEPSLQPRGRTFVDEIQQKD